MRKKDDFMKKTILLSVIAVLLVIFSSFVLSAFAEETPDYITDPAAFQAALTRGTGVIYVGDITFPTETSITLNFDVKLIGKPEKSTITGACFVMHGGVVPDETVKIYAENIIFDGGIDKSDYDFSTPKQTFFAMFGNSDRTDSRCFYGKNGYFSLTLTGCEITRYASYDAPALYVGNNVNYRSGVLPITLTDCRIHHNICYAGTVKIFHDMSLVNITRCSFCENTAKTAGGLVFSNGKGSITDTEIADNLYYGFVDTGSDDQPKNPDDTETFPVTDKRMNYARFVGSIYIGGANVTVRNCRITGNTALFGGGVGVCSSAAVADGSKIEFVDCVIADNTAVKSGGAIYAMSLKGAPLYFTNCRIVGNRAPEGGILFAVPYDRVPSAALKYLGQGGEINFAFCTMADNGDTGDNFQFVEREMQTWEQRGIVSLRGCLVLDTSSPCPEPTADNTGSYFCTREEAISSGILTEEEYRTLSERDITPADGSAADISIAPEVYSLWSEEYRTADAPRKIGSSIPGEEQAEQTFPWWIPALFIVLLLPAVVFGMRKMRHKADAAEKTAAEKETAIAEKTIAEEQPAEEQIPGTEEKLSDYLPDYSALPHEELAQRLSYLFADKGLTKKELDVAAWALVLERRRDIADKMVVSDETVKTHLSHIFEKLGISSRSAFRELTDRLWNNR